MFLSKTPCEKVFLRKQFYHIWNSKGNNWSKIYFYEKSRKSNIFYKLHNLVLLIMWCCVWEREREIEREKHKQTPPSLPNTNTHTHTHTHTHANPNPNTDRKKERERCLSKWFMTRQSCSGATQLLAVLLQCRLWLIFKQVQMLAMKCRSKLFFIINRLFFKL